MKKTAQGFTLVELLVVIAIIAILAAVVLLVVNPLELTRRGRDATRLADLSNIQNAINITMQEASGTGADTLLCAGHSGAPTGCTGDSSAAGATAINGSGWVKVDLTQQKSVSVSILPVDPVNSGTYKYTYAANTAETGYELDAVLESDQYKPKMGTDGSNDGAHYEVGTDLSAE